MIKKKNRADSHATEGEMARARPPSPPFHVNIPDGALPHWWAIVCAREYNAWTGPDLEHAANLACCLYDCERLRRELREEGDVVENAKGVLQVNPKHALLEQMTKRSIALSRLVHVHAEATSGKARDEVPRNKKQRELAEMLNAFNDEDLIARPLH